MLVRCPELLIPIVGLSLLGFVIFSSARGPVHAQEPAERYRLAYYPIDEQLRYVYDRGTRRCFAVWKEIEGGDLQSPTSITFVGVVNEQDCR